MRIGGLGYPQSLPVLLAVKDDESVLTYSEEGEGFDNSPFKILRDLIDILEINCEAANIEKQAKDIRSSAKGKTLLFDDVE